MSIRSIRAGARTGVFGEWLTNYLQGITKYQDYIVYYDHGDPTAHSNVVAIKGLYGEEVSRINQLAQVDILVAKPNQEILTIAEVEEAPSSPKKILGDTFALLMCNRFSVQLLGKHLYFRITPETRLIIAGTIVKRGSKPEQLEKVIFPRMKSFTVPNDTFNPKNVSFIFKGTVGETITELEETFITWFH
ncbi:MAG: hypothetical protein A2Z16_15975 [Chloroflexi bacterium RBG_16_54_18]|nr:MAG: hypothetical protein A2Z16_15975 [Chloroflexi bacterium RBG_16_54_18]